MKRIAAVLLVGLVMIGMLALPAAAQASCPTGYFATTLAKSGTPNLFRLGIKNGVVWTRIIQPNGAAPTPTRVFPDQILCVPGSGASTAAVSTINTTTTVVTTAPTTISATESAAIFNARVAAYCAGVPRNGLPADLGSCLIEAREVVAGNVLVVQENVACRVDEPAIVNGTLVQCSKLANKWLRFPVRSS
jgi:hypothetical protein